MILKVEHASFGFRKDEELFRDLNFYVGQGDLLAVLGPNGAGKTTLLRCVMGFLKWTSGRCLLFGEDARNLPRRRFWQSVAYVPQARGAASSLTVEDLILLGCTGRVGLFSTPSKAERALAIDLAENLGVAHLLKRRCNRISGGELQMALIARALIARPKLLILDEPESNLDFRNQLIVLDALSKLAARGIACVFNTHYPEHALARANRSLILRKDGQAVFGKTDEVLTEAAIERAFGVRSAILETERDGQVLRGVLPVALSDQG